MSVFGNIFELAKVPILDTFADSITYTPRGGAAYTLTCVLDSGEAVQTGERVYQTAWAPLSSFPAGEPARGDSVLIGATTYRVADIEKEHFGGRLLKLAVVSA